MRLICQKQSRPLSQKCENSDRSDLISVLQRTVRMFNARTKGSSGRIVVAGAQMTQMYTRSAPLPVGSSGTLGFSSNSEEKKIQTFTVAFG